MPNEVQNILDRYIEAAKVHGDLGDGSRKAVAKVNKAADDLARLEDILREKGQLHRLSELLTHENLRVREWAAVSLLEVDPDKAAPVLEELSKEPEFIGFNAQIILQEWRAGRLKSTKIM